MVKKAVYPGTFDPITNGHLDIICRSAKHLVDHLVIGVASDTNKNTLFSLDERTKMVRESIEQLNGKIHNNIEIVPFEGLLIDFVKSHDSQIVVRGLRAVTDFEYEFQMTGMNAIMAPDIETVFLMASEGEQFISSRFVKEIYRLGGDVTPFVPQNVIEKLNEKLC